MERPRKVQDIVHDNINKMKWERLDSVEGRRKALLSVGIIGGQINSDVVNEFAQNQMRKNRQPIKNQSR